MPRINVPPITRALLAALVALTFANLTLRFRTTAPILQHNPIGVSFLTIVPRDSYKFPWVAATSAFVEQNILSLVASALTIFFGGRYLERAWGGAEYAKFVLFVTVIPNVLAFFTYVFWSALGGSETRSYVPFTAPPC